MTNRPRLHADEASPGDKLLQLENETRVVGQTQDINSRIDLLEGSLLALQTELAVISKSFDEGLEHLDGSGLDLTSRVSETYKRLGEIDRTCKALTVISGNIDSEVKQLTEEIADVAAQSAADIEQQKAHFARQHVQLADRINDLVDHSRKTSARLTQSIEGNTDALLTLEKELVAEIDSLANTTQQHSDHIQKEDENSKARMLQLQAVDGALEKRAALLEASAAELTQKSRGLRVTVDLLDMRIHELSAMIDKLLEEGEKNASLIGVLQDKSLELAMSVKALAGRENRHFRILSGAVFLVVFAIAGLYFYQLSNMSHEAVVTAERQQAVDRYITRLQQENMKSAETISEVQDKLVALGKQLEHEAMELNDKLRAMDEQAQTLDGPISEMSSSRRIRSNNVIQGPRWLAQQPAERFAVQVASAGDKNELYNIAQRYSRYLQDELSYYRDKSGRGRKYVLLSGAYASEADAAAVRSRMPAYVNFRRPAVIRIGEVQKQL